MKGSHLNATESTCRRLLQLSVVRHPGILNLNIPYHNNDIKQTVKQILKQSFLLIFLNWDPDLSVSRTNKNNVQR
jgi:hypothetical protein